MTGSGQAPRPTAGTHGPLDRPDTNSSKVGVDDLRNLVSRVWGTDSGRVGVSTTWGPAPPGHHVVEQYAVVPSYRSPRYLLPTGNGKAVNAAFTRYLATPFRLRRLQGRLLGALWSAGVGDRIARDRLTVSVPSGLPVGTEPERLLMSRLRDLLDTDDLVAAWPVRRAMPASKPTARLMDRRGNPVGYVKVGWSVATRDLVQNETTVLEELDGWAGGLQVPRVLVAGTWADQAVLVTSPLPPLGAVTTAPESWPSAVLDIARSGAFQTTLLAGSAWLGEVVRRLDEAQESQPEPVHLLRRWTDRLVDHDQPLTFGRWHGDLVPWNLGRQGGQQVAWDWEYSAPSVPLGFDLLHWHFQTALSSPAATLSTGMRAVDAAAESLTGLGVPSSDVRCVAACYLVEMLTRATRLAASGAGWNPKLRGQLAGAVASRLR